jgi:uncharacterized protein
LKKQLLLLLELQRCDSQISEILRKKSEGPLRTKKHQSELDEVEKGATESEGRLETLRKERRNVEREVLDLEGKIEKSGIKLSSVKSNKEYTAALKEIEDLKTMRSSIEDRLLHTMEEIEGLERDIQVHKKKRVEVSAEVGKAVSAIQEEMTELENQLAELQKKRPLFLERIDKGLLKTYTLLMERKGGLAVSAVVKGVCQSCHIGFPPQQFNDLLKGDAIQTCPNCNRMIYWGEDEDFQAAQRALG